METTRIGNEDVIQQLPPSLQKLVTFERFHLHNKELFQNTSSDITFDTRYFPQNCGAIRLPCFWVRRKHLYVYGSQTLGATELNVFEGQGLHEKVLFPIHPTALDHYRQFLSDVSAREADRDGLRIWAVPTSSTRTFLAWPDREPERALFIKTSLCSPVLGDRRLYIRKVGCSVGLSKLMDDSRSSLPTALSYFSESVGFVPRPMLDSGVLIRSIPQEIKDGDVIVAPLFALMGGDGAHQPLLLTILDRTGLEPMQLVESVFCASFAKLWVEMSMHFGLILEAHGQDIMLGLALDLAPLGRFFYRDFEGVQIDWELRHQRGLREPENMPRACAWYDTYATWGYRYSNLVFYKLMISLHQYLNFVLAELSRSLCEWQQLGLIGGQKLEKDEVTSMFSRHMIDAIEDTFGIRIRAEYNIAHSLNRFVLALMKLRKDLLRMSVSG